MAAPFDPIGLGGAGSGGQVVGGPTLTSSGVGTAGALTVRSPETDLALGGGATGLASEMSAIKTSFDKIIRWRNRLEPMYRQFANIRAIEEAAYPGSKVTVFRTGANGIPLATTPLSDYADPDAKALPKIEDSLDVVVDEFGEATVTTQRLSRFSWTQIKPMQVEYVRRNMRDTTDAVYMNAIYSLTGGFLKGGFRQAVVSSGTPSTIALTGNGAMVADPMFNVGNQGLLTAGNGGGAAHAAATGYLDAAVIRRIVGHFRSLGVLPFPDGNYMGFITPDVSIVLRETTDLAGWRYPHLEENANGNIWNGTVGIFEGCRFVEGPQFKGLTKGTTVPTTATNIVNVAPTIANTSNLLFLGYEGITDVIVEEPHAVVTPQQDKFGRLAGLGWIGCWGAQVYDNNAGLLVACKDK